MLKFTRLALAFLGAFLLTYGVSSMEGDPVSADVSSEAPVKITFPAEKEKLQEEIAKGSEAIVIYIPNGHGKASSPEIESFPAYASNELESLRNLTIYHSLGSDRGYQIKSVVALVSLVRNTPKLERLTISQVLADDFLPHVHVNTDVFLDCGCAYTGNDTLLSQDFLEEFGNSTLRYYKELYPNHQISLLETEDVRGSF